MKLRLLLGLVIAGLAITTYRLATFHSPQPAQTETERPEEPPLLAKPPVQTIPEQSNEQIADEDNQDDPDEQVPPFRRLAADQLFDLALHAANAYTRADALEELAARRTYEALPAFLDRLADANSDVRRVAADGLAELGNESALSALERALPAEHVAKTRLAMAMAIAELHQDPSDGVQ